MRIKEFTGKTTQEAIDAGLAELGVTIADVHVDVLQEGAKGLFGLFGSKPARVRISVMEEEREDDQGLSDLLGSFSLEQNRQRKKEKKPAPKKEAPSVTRAEPVQEAPKSESRPEVRSEQPKAEKKNEAAEKPVVSEPAETEQEKPPRQKPPRERKPREKKPVKAENAQTVQTMQNEQGAEREYAQMIPAEPFAPTEPPVLHDESTPAGRAQRFLMDVTERMNVKVDVYVDDSKEDSLYIHMIGDTLGILIGRRGETLDALQYLTSLQVNKGREGYIRVTLDTENYRAKREDSLRRLAQRMANRAQKTGRKVVLEPMNPYERRVLHTALQNHPAVTTHSEGEEPNRRVVITLKGQPEHKAGMNEKAERAEKSDKPSGNRRRSRRRGRRGPKPENAAVQTESPIEETAAQTIDVLGGEE